MRQIFINTIDSRTMIFQKTLSGTTEKSSDGSKSRCDKRWKDIRDIQYSETAIRSEIAKTALIVHDVWRMERAMSNWQEQDSEWVQIGSGSHQKYFEQWHEEDRTECKRYKWVMRTKWRNNIAMTYLKIWSSDIDRKRWDDYFFRKDKSPLSRQEENMSNPDFERSVEEYKDKRKWKKPRQLERITESGREVMSRRCKEERGRTEIHVSTIIRTSTWKKNGPIWISRSDDCPKQDTRYRNIEIRIRSSRYHCKVRQNIRKRGPKILNTRASVIDITKRSTGQVTSCSFFV